MTELAEINKRLGAENNWCAVALVMLILVAGAQAHSPSSSKTIMTATSGLVSTPEVQVELESKGSGMTWESVRFVDMDGAVKFNGSIQAPSPCYTIGHRVERPRGNKTIIDIQMKRENGTQLCTQQIVSMSYEGSVRGAAGTVEVRHDGEVAGSFEVENSDSEDAGRHPGIINQIVSMMSKLLGYVAY